MDLSSCLGSRINSDLLHDKELENVGAPCFHDFLANKDREGSHLYFNHFKNFYNNKDLGTPSCHSLWTRN